MASSAKQESKRPARVLEEMVEEEEEGVVEEAAEEKEVVVGQRSQQHPQPANGTTTTTTTSTSSSTTISPPQPKRRRVADSARVRAVRACQRCRRLKEKCDGQHPCQRCFRSGRACEFAPVGMSASAASHQPSKSRLATASNVSVVSDVGPTNGESARSDERVKCLERLVQHLLGDVPMDLNNLRRMSDKARQKTSAASDVGSDRQATDDLDDLTLEDENFTVKTLSQSTAHYSGEFSHWNFSQKLRRRLSECLDSNVPVLPVRLDTRNPTNLQQASGRGVIPNRPGMRILEYWRATQLQSPKSLVQSVLSCLPPRAVAQFLTQVYFQFAQVNCFYAEEAWLWKKLDFLYEAPGHVTSEDSAWVCSVLMVLAIGTQFAHMAAGPPGDSPSETGDNERVKASAPSLDSDSDVGVTFYQMASKLIPDIITIASMESVQACLMLAHYALPLDTQGLAYTYLGLGIKMAIQNGMHRRYAGTDLDAWTIETRNRLWWTAYTVERRVSVLHGRPASISPTEVDAELPKDLSVFRQHDDVSKFANMSALIDMTLRLGDVANAMQVLLPFRTLLRRCPKTLQPTYFERIVDICQNLHNWWSTLDPSVQTPTPTSPLFRSDAHLKLCLYLNDIFVGRPFIFSQTNGASPGAISSPGVTRRHESKNSPASAHPDQADRPRNRAALVERAVEAAMNAILLLRTLHETTGLARPSYTEFSSCRAALLVMLAQSVNGPQSAELKAAIEMGMQLIRRMAVGNNVSTQSETSVLEALEIAVRRLHEMQEARGAVAEGDVATVQYGVDNHEKAHDEEVDTGKSGYERFRQWASLWPPSKGDQQHDATRVGQGRGATSGYVFPQTNTPSPLPGSGSWPVPHAGLVDQSPESARWMAMMDTAGVGIGTEQVDEMSLFGGFPELGALDGWPGLM
ncbi:hypothetical protein VP1G_09620 [Cytospora mali]|uniref:Zn(2)-C6 fungal-type domain-containing protein n=1 Tax=Cytospora mali TaxID=578113 RepID=A0A194VFE1_CYTMA|nr:hypothetical protein VP1G_09620 [Valsa mali var. pyri (nom. inval.)]